MALSKKFAPTFKKKCLAMSILMMFFAIKSRRPMASMLCHIFHSDARTASAGFSCVALDVVDDFLGVDPSFLDACASGKHGLQKAGQEARLPF